MGAKVKELMKGHFVTKEHQYIENVTVRAVWMRL
jgi:hypothetical protein